MVIREKYTCRRFILSLLFSVVACGLAIAGSISGGEFCSIVGVVLGVYGGADVMHKKHKMMSDSADT